MSNPFGSTVKASPATPVVGQYGQDAFINALQNATLAPNPNAPGQNMLQGVPAYTGQLTPDLSTSLSNSVWNSWTPNAPGMSQTQNYLGQLQNQMSGISGMQNQIAGMQNMYNSPGGGYNPYAGMMRGPVGGMPQPQSSPPSPYATSYSQPATASSWMLPMMQGGH